jgi:fluoride exporter
MNGTTPAADVTPEPRRRLVESAWAVVTHPLVLVTVGGAVGSLLRYVVGRWVDARLTVGGLPWGTFVVNVVGSFVLGVLALWVLERLPANYRGLYLLFGTGFCGGFTTFSTFEWETFKLVRDGSWALAGVNVFGSFACGFLGILAAVVVVHAVFGRP